MVSRFSKERFIDLVAILFIVLFIYASVNKLSDVDAFAMQLSKSPLMADMSDLVSWVVPIVEIGIAALLTFSITRGIGLTLALVLMSSFTWYILSILNFSAYVPCSCGGILGKLGWTEHLVFNIFFTVLSAAAVILSSAQVRNAIIRSATICLTSGAAVAILFLVKYDDRDKYSSFDRAFLDPPQSAGNLDLGVNSYYFAGQNRDTIYLGNVTASRLISSVDSGLQIVRPHKVLMASTFSGSTSLKVLGSDFFVFEGVTSNTFAGKVAQWTASPLTTNAANINKAVPFGRRSFLSRVLDTVTREYTLERLTADRPAQRKQGLLEKQVDGLFCVDGMMHAIPGRNILLYVYYYRNEYIVMDTLLRLKYRGHSIDSITRAKIEVKDVGERYHTIASIPLFVNKFSCADTSLLFIASGIRARNQTEAGFSAVTTVDVYDLNVKRYRGSFTIPMVHGKPKDLIVQHGSLFVLEGEYITKYDLRNTLPEYSSKEILHGQ